MDQRTVCRWLHIDSGCDGKHYARKAQEACVSCDDPSGKGNADEGDVCQLDNVGQRHRKVCRYELLQTGPGRFDTVAEAIETKQSVQGQR